MYDMMYKIIELFLPEGFLDIHYKLSYFQIYGFISPKKFKYESSIQLYDMNFYEIWMDTLNLNVCLKSETNYEFYHYLYNVFIITYFVNSI